MNVKEAIKRVKTKYPKKVILQCLEFPAFYGFALVDEDLKDEFVTGGYTTVNKHTGVFGAFNPPEDFDAFFAAQRIDLSELN